MNEHLGTRNDLAQHLRQTLHDGLCQQLAGSALLQSALVNRLEKLRQDLPGTSEQAAVWQEIVANARRVVEALREAAEEARGIIRELG